MEPGESSIGTSSGVPALASATVQVARGNKTVLSAAERRTLKVFAQRLSEELAGGREFHCLLADDGKLRTLNNQFLQHDYATDVLSFPASGDPMNVGDLAISLERAQAQAEEFGHSLADEIRVLMLHGVLHLLGYDHENDGGQMAREERRWRARFELSQGLIGRTRAGVRP